MREQSNIGTLISLFNNNGILKLEDISDVYREIDSNILQTTIYSRVNYMVRKGIIHRVGNGLYKLGAVKTFVPIISPKLKRVNQSISKKFPYINFCIWDLSFINTLSQHLINYNVIFVDVERSVVESVYLGLKDTYSKVMNVKNLYDDISGFADNIIVRPLVSSSPLDKIGKISYPTIEKLLVDISVDKEFLPFQGNEICIILETALEQYSINESRMFRYAERKNKKEEIKIIIDSIKRQ